MTERNFHKVFERLMQVFSSVPGPKTDFRDAQGYQRAGRLPGFINIFQNTNITVYELEHQKTVNTKLESK